MDYAHIEDGRFAAKVERAKVIRPTRRVVAVECDKCGTPRGSRQVVCPSCGAREWDKS